MPGGRQEMARATHAPYLPLWGRHTCCHWFHFMGSTSTSERRPPRLLEQVQEALWLRRNSPRTIRAYAGWIRRFILFNGKRHPRDMGEHEVTAFLSHLATEKHVSASTQNQALAALLFLYSEVLEQGLEWLHDLVRAKRPSASGVAEQHVGPADEVVLRGRSSLALARP